MVLFSSEGCSVQNRLLYYPSLHRPSDAQLAPYSLRQWHSASGEFRGYRSLNQILTSKGTVVIVHGNAGIAADRSYYMSALESKGFQVLLYEYPGYGGREGSLGEDSLVADLNRTLTEVFDQYGDPIFLVGESLGCGVVGSLMKEPPIAVAGVLLITPWDSLESLAREMFPHWLVWLFLRDKFDTINNIKNYKGPVAIVGAENDQVIPIHHAQKLHQSLRDRSRMWVIPTAGHNDWINIITMQQWHEIFVYLQSSGRP